MFKKLIQRLWERFVLPDILAESLNEEPLKPDIPEDYDPWKYRVHPTFDNEIDRAMYERQYHTLQ
jgi:hypothetical protein